MNQTADVAALSPEVRRIYQSAAFAELRRRRQRLSITLTVIMCLIYYSFILAIAFTPQLLAIKLDGIITLGIPLGLGVIFSVIVVTGIYVQRANGEFDRLTAKALESARS